jgi:hypothetical protein
MSTDEIKDQINTGREQINAVREKIFAMSCVTVIAIACILKLSDPENIIINIIVAIASFVGGEAYQRRKADTDSKPQG